MSTSLVNQASLLIVGGVCFFGGIARATSGAVLPALYAYQLTVAPGPPPSPGTLPSPWLSLIDFASAWLLAYRKTRRYAAGLVTVATGMGLYTAYSKGLDTFPVAMVFFGASLAAALTSEGRQSGNDR
ncbi:hypothetical protein MKEN_00282100 [Mycena kentingensis (nom. inval.)]|nr:hypothetical protein MKEN_00282100 [Mycena kentingensis (nom. inval.)]